MKKKEFVLKNKIKEMKMIEDFMRRKRDWFSKKDKDLMMKKRKRGEEERILKEKRDEEERILQEEKREAKLLQEKRDAKLLQQKKG